MMICNYSAYVNDKSKELLCKYRKGLANIGEARKRKEMARWIRSMEPFALCVGIGEITLFILDRESKVFVFKTMLDYSMETVFT